MKKLLLLLLLLTCLFAEGNLNVFTSDKDAEIFIDGKQIGKEQVLKHPLQAGTHYLQIKKNSKVLRSQTVEIYDNKTETVVLDDFVDYRTDVPSRGSLDVEAMRVRETRGNVAFGLYGGSPASGLSLKWWPWEKIGLQAIGYVNNFDGNRDTRYGARLLWALNESVFNKDTFTTYLALGAGRSTLFNMTDDEKNEIYDLTELAFGIEFKLQDFFKSNTSPVGVATNTAVVIDINEDNVVPMLALSAGALLLDAFSRFVHLSGEVGVERIYTRYFLSNEEPSSERINIKVSGGLHIYF